MIGLAVLAFVGPVILAQGAPIVSPPQNVTVTNQITVQAPPPDPEAIAEASVQSSQSIITMVVAPPLMQWSNELLGLPDIWRTTPPELTYQHGAIRELAELLRNVAFALIALMIFAKGAGYALGQELEIGRLLFAVFLSAGNLILWEIGIRLNNGITAAIAAPDLPSLIRPHLQTSLDPSSAVGLVILLIVYALVALMLLFSLLFRLGLLDVLIAVGSLALICYATPQTEHLASHYSRLSVAMLFGQVLIVLGLRVAAVLAGLGSGGVLGTLLSIVVLMLVRSLPQTLISGGSQRQGNHWGTVALMMLRRRVGL